MMRAKDERISGWGRAPSAQVRLFRPEDQKDVPAVFPQVDAAGVIARGAGRSYGDAALNGGGAVTLMSRLNRMLAFDAVTGHLVCEAGVTFDDLATTFLPRGWFAPVTPGTAFATLGGALANDVHGKNHERVGSFGDHVLWFDLVGADGIVRRISPETEPETFAATIGGIGLTGIVVALCLRLMPIASPVVAVHEQRMRDIDAFLAAFTLPSPASYSVGWIDCLGRRGALGRGILQLAEPARSPRLRPYRRNALSVPIDLPAFALNGMSVGAFNALYFRRVPRGGRVRFAPLQRFLYPLDAVANWNRLYGRPGFHQFQAVIPTQEAARGVVQILEALSAARAASFLSVIKRLGRSGRGHLSFAQPGITLAVDIPAKRGAAALIHGLHRITLDHGGRIYLAKDALLSPEDFRRMYPDHDRFVRLLEQLDPGGLFQSDMARRLGIRRSHHGRQRDAAA